MKKLKYEILFTILFMTIGIAAVTGNILISGSTELAANNDDFDVYFSDIISEKSDTLVSINNSKSFAITTELKELNEEDKVNFKVTNASQNYDAEVSIDCTSESVYLKAIPHLSSNIVPAREEIDGFVSIKMVRQSIENKYSQKITCTINANAVERSSLSTGIEYNEKLVMLKNSTSRDAMGFEDYKSDIKTITFQESIEIHPEAIETWDFGVAENGNVMAFIIEGDGGYDLYIQSNEQLYGNPDMSYWLSEFNNLETVNNIELLDTSEVTRLDGLFYDDENLQTIDLSSWDTSNVTNMSSMFYYNAIINSINLSGWDTSNVTDMSSVFEECYELTTIIGLEDLVVNNVTNMSSLFYYTSNLENLDISSWDTSKVTNMSYMIAGTNITDLDLSELETNNVTDMSYMFAEIENTTLDLSDFDTSNVTDMSGMFSYTNISNLDLSELETSKVTNMSYMFRGIGNTTLDLTNFDTSNVTNMKGMFFSTNISNLDLNELETSKVTNMSYMFSELSNTTLDLSSFDTSNVTDMSGMFNDCTNLKSIVGLENLNTSNVTNMSYMFSAAENITNLDLSSFDTSKVTDMRYMFYRTDNLESINLSGWDTSKVTNMSSMFSYAGQNNTNFNIDLSKLDTSSVTNMSSMFNKMGYNSTKLNTSITIRNPNTIYSYMLANVATKSGTKFTFNYTSETESLVNNMIATKDDGANVVKGTLVE